MRTALLAAAVTLVVSPAFARTIVTSAQCRLPQGVMAKMVTQTKVYATGGLVYPGGRHSMPDFVGSGQKSMWHSGYVSSRLGHYTFTGQGAFIDFGHRGPVFQVIWRNRQQYVLKDAKGSGWGVIPCTVQSIR